MKKNKTLAILLAASALSMGIVSCGPTQNDDNKKDDDIIEVTKTGTVSLIYNQEHGTITTNKLEGEVGEEITLNIQAKEGYEVLNIKINNQEVALTTTSFVLIEGNNNVEVNFKEIIKTGTVNLVFNSSYGSVTANKLEGNVEDEITLTITPNSSYKVTAITVNGTSVSVTTRKITLIEGVNTIEVTFEKVFTPSIKLVKETLTGMQNGNYQVDYTNNEEIYSYYRTTKYDYRSELKEGHVVLKDVLNEFNGEVENKVHNFKVNDNKVVLGGSAIYVYGDKEYLLSDLSRYDWLNELNFDEVYIRSKTTKTFISSDENLLWSIGQIINSEFFASYGTSVEFAFDQDENLTFTPKIDVEGYNFPTFTVKNIGETKAPVVDDYFNNYQEEEERMNNEIASSILGSAVKFESDIYLVTNGNKKSLGKKVVSYDENHLVDSTEMENYASTNTYIKQDEYAYKPFINPQNEIGTQKYNEWEAFGWVNNTFNPNDFVKTSENEYTYFGSYGEKVSEGITWAVLGDYYIDYIIAHVEDNKVTNIDISTSSFYGEDENENTAIKRYEISTKVSLPGEFEDVTGYEEDENTPIISAYFEQLTKKDANYTLILGDRGNTTNTTTYKVTEDMVLAVNSNPQTYVLYKKVEEGKFQEFRFKNSNGELKAVRYGETFEAESGSDVMGLNINPAVMTFNDNEEVVAKANVKGFGDALGKFSYSHSSWLMDETLVFRTSNTSSFTGFEYKYGQGTNYVEYGSIYGYNSTTIGNSEKEEGLLTAIEHVDDEDPYANFSWKDDSEVGYQLLIDLMGEEKLSEITYIYVEGYSLNWSKVDKNETSSFTVVRYYYPEEKTKDDLLNAYHEAYEYISGWEASSNFIKHTFSDGSKVNLAFAVEYFAVQYYPPK